MTLCYSLLQLPRWRWIGIGLVLAALTLPKGVVAQPAPVQSLLERGQQAGANMDLVRTVVDRANEAGLSPDATADVLDPAIALAEQDLPTGPVLNKALEGLSKRVPPDQMISVLQDLQTHTKQAGELVSTWLAKDEVRQLVGAATGDVPDADRTELIANITDAQQQKVSIETVRAFLNRLPEATDRRPIPLSDVSVAVSVLPELPDSDATPQTTQQLLIAALDAGYDAESTRQLPAAVERARHETQRPIAAIAEGTAQAISWGTPAASVLQNLFRGTPPAGDVGRTGHGPDQNGPPNDPPGGEDGNPPGNDGGGPPGGDGGGPPGGNGGGPPGGGSGL